jgi:hypothetical protein
MHCEAGLPEVTGGFLNRGCACGYVLQVGRMGVKRRRTEGLFAEGVPAKVGTLRLPPA